MTFELYKYETATGSVTTLQLHSGTVGWFLCEDEAQSSFPATSAEALGTCSLNGVTWQIDHAPAYFFSSSDAGEFFIAAAPSSACSDATLHSICDYVGELPPYSCSREVSQGAYDVIGTATANSELFYLILVTILARLLFLFKRDGDPASTGTTASVSASSAEEGVELGRTNPLHDERSETTSSSDRELIQKLTDDLADLTKLTKEHAQGMSDMMSLVSKLTKEHAQGMSDMMSLVSKLQAKVDERGGGAIVTTQAAGHLERRSSI